MVFSGMLFLWFSGFAQPRRDGQGEITATSGKRGLSLGAAAAGGEINTHKPNQHINHKPPN